MSGYRRRGAHLAAAPLRVPAPERHARSHASLPVFAAMVSLLFVSVAAVPHASSLELGAPASAAERSPTGVGIQEYEVAGAATIVDQERSDYGVTERHILSAPAVGIPDPGSAQAIAYDLVMAKGWDEQQYACLVALWNRESHWNVYAHNPTSGAYGIPQALPGDKMASVADDWATNPRTQIIWGLGYIQGRYGTPCAAWESSETRGWY